MDKSLILFVGISCFLLTNGVKVEDCDYMTETDYTRFQSFQALEPEEQPYRTAYHFQSPKNWLNAKTETSYSFALPVLFLFLQLTYLERSIL
ncbi:hypothetical protein V6N13_066577 [Hibiscus sabdariffa]